MIGRLLYISRIENAAVLRKERMADSLPFAIPPLSSSQFSSGQLIS